MLKIYNIVTSTISSSNKEIKANISYKKEEECSYSRISDYGYLLFSIDGTVQFSYYTINIRCYDDDDDCVETIDKRYTIELFANSVDEAIKSAEQMVTSLYNKSKTKFVFNEQSKKELLKELNKLYENNDVVKAIGTVKNNDKLLKSLEREIIEIGNEIEIDRSDYVKKIIDTILNDNNLVKKFGNKFLDAVKTTTLPV